MILTNVKDFALILLEGAALIFPPLRNILGDAMTSHSDPSASPGEAKLADEIRAKLGVESASARAARALDEALLRPAVKMIRPEDVASETDPPDENPDENPNPETDPVPSAPTDGGRS